MRTTIAVALLVFAACARKPPKTEPAPGVTIVITARGYVKVDGKAISLDQLSTVLAARRDAAPLEEVGPWKFKASSLPVRLDLEDDVAWGHVQWVMVVLAEEKFWRLSLPGGRESPLPIDHSGGIRVPPDAKALLVRVLALEDGAYALGKRTTRDLADVGRWIDEATRAGAIPRIGVLRTWPRTPWRHVLPLLDLLTTRCGKRVEFYGVEIPPRDARHVSPLPMPAASPAPRSWGGLVPVDYSSHSEEYSRMYEEEPTLPEEQLLAWLHYYRVAAGEAELLLDGTLGTAASLHAEEMGRLGYFGHSSPVPGNRLPGDRLAKLGWQEERRYVEILAKAEDAEAAFRAIAARPENEKVLADPAFKCAGVAQSGDCWVVLLGAE